MAESSSSSESETCQPQAFVPIPSAICSLLVQHQLLTGWFRDWLMRHFTSPLYIEQPDLRKLIWKPGEDTGILIETNHRWRPALTEKRPAVIIKRNDFSKQRVGAFGEVRQGPPVDLQGNRHLVTFWVGSYTLFCIGGSGAQAELLGTEVQREIGQFAPVMMASIPSIMRLDTLQVGAVSQLQEAKDNWAVPVTVGVAYEERWVLRQQAPRMKVSLSLLSEC